VVPPPDDENGAMGPGPRLSIFIPVRNGARTLPDTLDSLLDQSFSDFEVIVVDDGSTDTTREVASGYAERDPRVRVLPLPHGGEVVARNAGLAAGHPAAAYRMNHDADDISLPGKLEALVGYLDAKPEVAIVGCGAEYFDDDGSPRGEPAIELDPARIRATFGTVNSMIHSASLVRSEVYDEIGGYREEWRSVDDYELFARALLAGFELANLPAVLHRSRLHPASVSSTRAPEILFGAARVGARFDLACDSGRGPIARFGGRLRYWKRLRRARSLYRRATASP